MNEAVQWLLKAIPTYVLTFGRVFVAPKTEILEKCRGEDSAVPGALVFLGVSQLLLYPLARGSTEPHSEFWDTALRSVSLIIVGGLATLGMLALAWRIMGVRIEFSKLLVAYCYTSGVSWVGLVGPVASAHGNVRRMVSRNISRCDAQCRNHSGARAGDVLWPSALNQ